MQVVAVQLDSAQVVSTARHELQVMAARFQLALHVVEEGAPIMVCRLASVLHFFARTHDFQLSAIIALCSKAGQDSRNWG